MQLGTKEFIHCVNHTLRLVASKEADQAQVYLLLLNWEVLQLASCEYGFTLSLLIIASVILLALPAFLQSPRAVDTSSPDPSSRAAKGAASRLDQKGVSDIRFEICRIKFWHYLPTTHFSASQSLCYIAALTIGWCSRPGLCFWQCENLCYTRRCLTGVQKLASWEQKNQFLGLGSNVIGEEA